MLDASAHSQTYSDTKREEKKTLKIIFDLWTHDTETFKEKCTK